MQLLILWGRQFEDAFDEKHSGKKVKQLQPVYIFSIRQFEDTFDNIQGGAHTNVTSVTRHSLMQAIWVTLLDSMVASFGVKFPRGMVWYRISIGIGIRIGIDGGSVVVCCMVLQEW